MAGGSKVVWWAGVNVSAALWCAWLSFVPIGTKEGLYLSCRSRELGKDPKEEGDLSGTQADLWIEAMPAGTELHHQVHRSSR